MREHVREQTPDGNDHGHEAVAQANPEFAKSMAAWGKDDTLAERQRRAIATLEAARTGKPASKWPHLDADKVLEQAIERVNNPFTTNISGPYFCGPTLLMSVITEKEPDKFAKLVIEVLTAGTFNGKKVNAKLLATDPADSGGKNQVDWMFMSSMRNTHPNMFGEYIGEQADDYGKAERSLVGGMIKAGPHETAGTSVSRMKGDVKGVLDYKIVKSKYYWVEDLIKDSKAPNRFVDDGLPEVMERLPSTYDPEERTVCGILIGFGEGSGEGILKHLNDGGLKDLPDAIHWNRIVTKPVLGPEGYTFELFEHGSKRTETWTAEKFNKDVYGYVIAERRK